MGNDTAHAETEKQTQPFLSHLNNYSRDGSFPCPVRRADPGCLNLTSIYHFKIVWYEICKKSKSEKSRKDDAGIEMI